jgi:two-component system CheB/CheR fusion protein
MGHDFSDHKESTLRRRLERRMSLNKISDVGEYTKLLRENQQEAQALFREFLIGVTHFFRDSDAFATLKEEVLPGLIDSLSDDEVFRAWVPGCSTGEEALSLAIVIREVMEEQKRSFSLQIFATDLDERAIETARRGIYPASIAADVSEERLHRFFHKEGDHYRVRKDIRDIIVFSGQDLLTDPPFSRLHIVCSRNVLIYLKPEAQKKLLPLFHYTLNSDGVLVLGSSESIGSHTNLFQVIDQRNKIFRRRDVPASVRGTVQFPTGDTPLEQESRREPEETSEPRAPESVGRLTEQLMLDRFAPTGVLIEQDGTIVHVQGKTGKYLEAMTGPPTTNILDLARQGMRLELASAVRAARSEEEPVVRSDVWVKTNGDMERVELEVIPLKKPDRLTGRLLVVFREQPETSPQPEEGSVAEQLPEGEREARIAELEAELQKTRESHQATVEELESANEELKSTNEELQSANEELQSTNEEHESSKEELQALNEELHTTNTELEHKINELQAVNDDIRNLFNSAEIASVFVDNELKVRRFTEQAKRIINLIDFDVGRPLSHLVTNLAYDDLIEDVKEVPKTLETKEREVETEDGTWYKMRIIPYRTVDNRIDGAILTFFSIHEQKMAQKRIEAARNESKAAWLMVRTVFDMNPQGLAVLDEDRSVVIANDAFAAAVGVGVDELEGKPFSELPAGEEREGLKQELEQAYEKGQDFRAGPVSFSDGGSAGYIVTGQVVRGTPELPYRVLLRLEAAGDE